MSIEYNYFKVGDLFPNNLPIKKFAALPESIGDVPFVSSSSFNNGISGMVDEVSYEGQCITVSTNGKCFDAFYHNGKIAISTDVELLKNEHLNVYNAMYLCTILNAETFKWGYGRKPKNNKVFTTRIKLPVASDGAPDWIYMESYIKGFINKNYSFGSLANCLNTQSKMQLALKIHDKCNDVKLFQFKDLLTDPLYKAKAYAKIDLDAVDFNKPGYVPFVSRTDTNNAIDCFVKDSDSLQKEDGNCIIIGDTTSTIYYQPDPFVAGDHIVVCRAPWINKYTAMYIKTLLDKERYRYSYGRAFKKDFINNTILALPIDSDGNPDWAYMEDYIKSLPYGDRI